MHLDKNTMPQPDKHPSNGDCKEGEKTHQVLHGHYTMPGKLQKLPSLKLRAKAPENQLEKKMGGAGMAYV